MKRFLQYLSEAKRRSGSDFIDLFHGTVEEPSKFSGGIDSQRGRGLGGSQGAGFYAWTQRSAARKHASGVAAGDFQKNTATPRTGAEREMMVSTRTHVSDLIPDAEILQKHIKGLNVLANWQARNEDRINSSLQKQFGEKASVTQANRENRFSHSMVIRGLPHPNPNIRHTTTTALSLQYPGVGGGGSHTQNLSTLLQHLHTHDRSLVDELVRDLHSTALQHKVPIAFRYVGKNVPKARTRISEQYISEAKKTTKKTIVPITAPEPVHIGKQSLGQIQKEVTALRQRNPNGMTHVTYGDIGHWQLDPEHYHIYGTKQMHVPTLWWSQGGTDVQTHTPKDMSSFPIHGRGAVPSGASSIEPAIKGVGGEGALFKGRIDHERKAISLSVGGRYDSLGMMGRRILEKNVPAMVGRLKQIHPEYGVHFFHPEGGVHSF